MNFENVILCEGPEWSYAAALGGTTTVVDFAFQEPPHTLHDTIADKKELMSASGIDYGIHAILTKDFSFAEIEEIGDVIRGGIPTIKTMMTYGYMSDDGQRYGVMAEVAEHGGMSVVHAEDDAIAGFLTQKYIREGKTHGAYICEVRGPLVEEAAIRRAMFLAERTGSPLYVLHMAAAAGIDALTEARGRGLPFYGETLTTYLHFTQDEMWDESPIEVNGKTYNARGLLIGNYPTPKFPPDRDACWEAIADDRLQIVGTDHAATSLVDRFEKMGCVLPFVQAGQICAPLRVPLLFHHGVNSGRFSASRFVELISTNPAKVTGLWPRKGQIAPGSDADIAVLDPRKEWTVRLEDLHQRDRYTIWEGFELTGKVRHTVLRGAVIVEDEQFVGSKSGGEFIPRTLLPEIVGGDFSFTRRSLEPRVGATAG
jgi:dihydropyrimidinase